MKNLLVPVGGTTFGAATPFPLFSFWFLYKIATKLLYTDKSFLFVYLRPKLVRTFFDFLFICFFNFHSIVYFIVVIYLSFLFLVLQINL